MGSWILSTIAAFSANDSAGAVAEPPFRLLRRLALAAGAIACAGALAACGGEAATISIPADVWGGIYTDAQAKRGEDVYYAHCIECHGQDLSGATSYDPAPALTGKAFQLRWDKKSVADIFTLARTEMPKKKPATLKPTQYADALAFIFKANGFPAGQTEMPADVSVLRRVSMPGHQ
jgi:mono/diheme cytochrome c family protein